MPVQSGLEANLAIGLILGAILRWIAGYVVSSGRSFSLQLFRIVPCLLTVLIIVGADIDQQTRYEMAALQQIAVSTSQIAKDNAAEHARMDKHDERIEEMLDTWPA